MTSIKAERYLKQFCVEISERYVGSFGNKKATELFASYMNSFGFHTELPEFECIDWRQEGARCSVNGTDFQVYVSPYSLGGRLEAPLNVVSSVEELETVAAKETIVLLLGDIAKEPLMPKNFSFYNPEEHQRIIHLLETKGFKAVIAATSRNPEMAGGIYPFPLIEDGDFNLPSVYMTAEEGARLARCAGKTVSLEINANRIPSKGYNMIASKGKTGQRVVLFAHIDSKQGSQGAIDNAAGIVVLLLLAELLSIYDGNLEVEIVAINGEDYYSNPGEVLYLTKNSDSFSNILLGVNIDGVGFRQRDTAFSVYDCPAWIEAAAHKAFSSVSGIVEGELWYQGDHGLFLQNERPAIALTSGDMMALMKIAHTPEDTLAIVDSNQLVAVASALHNLITQLSQEKSR